jgi:hypothetical protein
MQLAVWSGYRVGLQIEWEREKDAMMPVVDQDKRRRNRNLQIFVRSRSKKTR